MRIEGAAACVWESLSTPRDIAEIVAEITREDAPPADLAADVARTLHSLAAAGLVECA
jgi:hypothetical protein